MKDNEIIDLYFARNENAISETAQKYGRMLKAIAYGILKNVSDCEECENDTYFAAWNKIPPQIPKALAAFLGRITRNIALDKYAYYTADKRNREFETTLCELEEILPGGTNPAQHYENVEFAECITAFLHAQSYTKRVVFVRRYWYCDTIAEIASAYRFSESKVKSMLMRMRNELKIFLERNDIGR